MDAANRIPYIDQTIAEQYYSSVSILMDNNSDWSEHLSDHSLNDPLRESLNNAKRIVELTDDDVNFLIMLGNDFQKNLQSIVEITNKLSGPSKAQSNQPDFFTQLNTIANRALGEFQSLNRNKKSAKSSSDILSYNSKGEKVKQLQEALKKSGFFNSAVDGIFGPATQSAVKSFQSKNNLGETGEVDSETFNMILNSADEPVSQKFSENVSQDISQQKETINSYLPFYLSEGNDRNKDDQLDFENDIESLASVITLKEVKPPLAIGLFGNWGSGKSFFMEKLAKKIEDFTQQENESSVKNVVQVKFNSWHYSDANLWASLITEIFESLSEFSKKEEKEDELKKLSKSLQVTNLQKEAVEHRYRELEKRITELEADKQDKRERLEDLSGIKLLKLILSNEKIQGDLKELRTGNIENILNDKNKVEKYIHEIKDDKNRLVYYFRLLKSLKGWNWVLVLTTMFVVFALAYIIPKNYSVEWEQLTLWVSGVSSVVVAFIANALKIISPARKSLNKALERLESIKNTLDNRPEVISPELEKNMAELESLKKSLTEIDQKIYDTEKEINDILSGKKLLEFVEQRARDENYAKQLGLISWIRKDFNKLDELLRKQHELSEEEKQNLINPENVKLKIDRIVLYIDDLDRCNEDIVVRVLEAIHLLLAFPLFVVVVGVDPRWLNNALSEKYKRLLGKNNKVETESFLIGGATTYDYLEKIFQIPFCLKPINKTGREKLITYLIRNEMAKPKPNTNFSNNISNAENSNINNDSNIKEEENIQQNNNEIETNKLSSKQKLTFLQEELRYMKKISPLFGQSPRGINRFMNVYRIIKSHRSLRITENFSEDEFIPILFVLSIMVGFASYAESFVEELSNANDDESMKSFLKNSKLPKDMTSSLQKYLDENIFFTSLKPFKRNLELISRFSFRTLNS